MQVPPLFIPALPHISWSVFINTPILIIILTLFFIVYAIITSILMYHWSAYGMKSSGILVGQTLFLFVSVILFVIAGLAVHYF